ncbi:hypothetical protein DESC_530011 [Desulfosarcina cetonica]|nr:hypothetical protein DESC_530011 [Desulfosarcina cetonica]
MLIYCFWHSYELLSHFHVYHLSGDFSSLDKGNVAEY